MYDMDYDSIMESLRTAAQPYSEDMNPFRIDENGDNECLIRDTDLKYIVRIDNFKPMKDQSRVIAFEEFCKFNGLNQKTSRFGWLQTDLENFAWRLNNGNYGKCSFKLFKITDKTVMNYHELGTYVDFLYYNSIGGYEEDEYESDKDRSDRVNDSRNDCYFSERDTMVQTIFEEDTAEEVYSSDSVEELFAHMKSLGIMTMINA